MSTFITEDWLRANHTLSEGSEIRLPVDSRMTPSARELIDARHLLVKFQDDEGRLFVEEQEQLLPVHGLTSEPAAQVAHCELCKQHVQEKPDTLTHLNAQVMVAKNDPRLAFRASLDSSIATAVWLQTEFDKSAALWLADIRSLLGNIMRADALEKALPEQQIVGLSADDLHRLSHQPLKYLGHDHLVPDAAHGRDVALLNLLRTSIRESEICAAQVFIGVDYHVQKADLLQALNRLSSAIYVLMILCLKKEWPDAKTLQRRLAGGTHAA
ncbi:ethanolamine utilization ATP:cob(I)alamin adenosyltransferase [Buttiauxella ferragutiae ATCC 51602]|uniref:Ethanolamine utilization ATP:cob(I)alamin adenosyltransferase n=1 Tax=Buttiauxella ferragutiae ATCC 51602 TaxID=1354252 RepID=A0ABX2W4D6_9ENTR|nr:ethanolamine utilization cob(I)yrinic acid a,c-diamide adenosyltransferase EutT [Buttiauxella ferragutiae]OAT25499.1 ethanolamine utilization ATP:cob(I)alamin adenosyltransferase [Buttiauxella ferragutiae ATCC 51602]